jgi:hypothetical protein
MMTMVPSVGHALRAHPADRKQQLLVAVVGWVVGLFTAVVVALIGNATNIVNVSVGLNRRRPAGYYDDGFFVRTRLRVQLFKSRFWSVPRCGNSSGRTTQWSGTVLAGAVDFDPQVPNNQADGASREIEDSSGNDVDGELEGGFNDDQLAVWIGPRPPTVDDCLVLDSTQAMPRVTVFKGTVLCIHTDADRLVIAKVTRIDKITNGRTYLLQATVYGPA